MANGHVIAYNVAAFVSSLFLFEFGADKLVEHTAIVSRRAGIPDTIIALLTAGAEWKEVSFKRFSIAFCFPADRRAFMAVRRSPRLRIISVYMEKCS